MKTPSAEFIRALVLIAVFVAAAFLMNRYSESRWQAKTDAVLDSAAVARTEAKVNAALAAEHERRANIAVAERRTAEDRAVRAISDADRLRAQRRVIVPVASEPGAAPTVSDTLRAVDSALVNCDQETVVLRAALEHNRNAAAASDREAMEIRGALSLERTSVATLTRNLEHIETQLASADPPCRIAFFACPSRTVVAVVSAISGAVIYSSLTRAK